MIKRTLTILFAALAIAAAPALASVVTLDFTGVNAGINSPLSATVNGTADLPFLTTLNNVVNFTYVEAGTNELAAIQDTIGLYAFTSDTALTGVLIVTFNQVGVKGLLFNYTIDGGSNEVFASFTPSGDSLEDLTGTFSYGSMAIDPANRIDTNIQSASLAFALNGGTGFTINSMQYDWAPEPASFLLIGTGLLAVGGFRRLRRKA
jgi:hypothetical protein